MTRRRTSGKRSRAKASQGEFRFSLDPLFACLVFAGIGLGTFAVKASPRLAILWTVLLVLWVVYREGKSLKFEYEFREIGRGMLIGLAVSVPLVLLAFRGLATAIPILFVGDAETSLASVSATTVFMTMVLLAPVAEELFFRDILQREQGLWLAVGLYAAAGLVLFLPTAGKYPVVLAAVVGAWSLLGAMYGFFHERFGFATTLSSHVTINLVLLYVPAAVAHLGLFTS